MEIQREKEEKFFKYSKEEKKRTDRRGESMNANEAGRRIIGVITLTLQWLNIRKWDLFGGTCVKPQ